MTKTEYAREYRRRNPDRVRAANAARRAKRAAVPRPSWKPGRTYDSVAAFWSKVDQSAGLFGCWPWLGYVRPDGYGTFNTDKTSPQRAHRFSYELLVGPIPAGLTLDHLCRNRACVNPAHLEPVTQRENTLRGEAPAIRVYRSGICKRGHARTPDNVTRHRVCRACSHDRYLASRQAALA